MTQINRAFEIVRALQSNGHEAMFVGGWVRDHILGIKSDDVDIVTSALTKDIRKIFPQSKSDLGTMFQVNIVDEIEVATYRYDTEDGFALFAECFIEDSSRRDLTINSMGFDPISNEIIDHWNGQNDVENKLIRFVGVAQSRIEEDPVRMLRACRFASKINGRLVPSAFFAIKDNADLIKDIPAERIQKEIMKAMSSDKPSIFWNLLQRTGLLKIIIPELDDCWWHTGGKYHSEYVHEHLMDCGDYIWSNPIVRLAGYLHDIGKVDSYDEYDFSFLNHDKFGADIARDVLVRLKFNAKDIEYICSLILMHMRSIEVDSSARSCRRTLVKLNKHNVELMDFLVLKFADRNANRRREGYSGEEINQIIHNFENAYESAQEVFSIKDLQINGNDVLSSGIKPGKNVGTVLNY